MRTQNDVHTSDAGRDRRHETPAPAACSVRRAIVVPSERQKKKTEEGAENTGEVFRWALIKQYCSMKAVRTDRNVCPTSHLPRRDLTVKATAGR